MGKSHRKFIKKEKARVKLKETKTKLPKGQNLTDTNFKVKKIVIKDQVKPHEQGEILTVKKLNVQDLLSRLEHHNMNMKKEAIEGLNELISSHSTEIIAMYLSNLLQSVTKLILDLMGPIRKEAIKLLANILSKTQCQQLEPFFPSMSSYLVCGLTHIDHSIREDSLHFLDTLLKYVPMLCAKSAYKLLTVCMDLVSHQNSANRTLSLNLESSSTSMKWRDKVLYRIHVILKTLIDAKNESFQDETGNKNKDACIFDIFQFEKRLVSKLQLSCFNKNIEVQQDFSLQSFCDSIIPLLLDIFIETVPQKEDVVGLSTDVCTIIKTEEADLLKNVVSIIHLLWNIIEREDNSTEKLQDLSNKHRKALIIKLINGRFPYALRSCHVNKKQKTDNVQKIYDDSYCRLQNLTLCKLVILFGKISDRKFVIPYLKSLLRHSEVLNKEECLLFTSCVTCICQSTTSESKYFLNQVSKTVITSRGMLVDHLFLLLAEIALDRKYEQYHNEDNFVSWLESLPKKLTKPKISGTFLEKIRKISIRNFKGFSESLDVYIESILDNIPRIQVEGMDKEEAEKQIASLLYHVKECDDEFLENLNKAIEKEYWGHVVTRFIKDILELKKEMLIDMQEVENANPEL